MLLFVSYLVFLLLLGKPKFSLIFVAETQKHLLFIGAHDLNQVMQKNQTCYCNQDFLFEKELLLNLAHYIRE